MTRNHVRTLLVAGLLLASTAEAHEGGAHVRGIIQEAAPDHLVIHTETGDVTVALTAETQIARSGAPADHTAPAPGERVVVHARKGDDGKLDATEVKLAPKK